MLYGVYREPARVDWNVVAEFKELEIRGGHLAPTEFGMALDLLARRAVDGRPSRDGATCARRRPESAR